MTPLESFCSAAAIDGVRKKIDQAVLLLFYHCKVTGESEATMQQVVDLFAAAGLATPNTSRLKDDFKYSTNVIRGSGPNTYRLSRKMDAELNQQHGAMFNLATPITIEERTDLAKTPLLTAGDIDAARRMAELYV